METKICNKCKVEKELTINFYKNNARKSGYHSICKECKKIKKRSYRNKNREKINENNKLYLREYRKRIKYPELKPIEKIVIADFNDKKYHKRKMETDPLYKCATDIRGIIKNSIARRGYKKNSKTHEILGCSFDDFRLYIEKQFEPWMSFFNHGNYTGNYSETWQYDHIIPISSGMSEEEIIKLNHYTNFRPLCSKLNNEKSNKWENPYYN